MEWEENKVWVKSYIREGGNGYKSNCTDKQQ